MCHSSVHLVEYTGELAEELRNTKKEETHHMEVHNATIQNEAFHLQTESFKKLGIAIEKYEEVILFGPIDAKVELMNFLKSDKRFDRINITIKQTNIMSEDQQQSFVEQYFSNL
jgi:hypothetical protein